MRTRIFVILAFCSAFVSCSTTRVLKSGESRLAKNEIVVTDSKKVTSSELTPYILQAASARVFFGWNPLMSVYNWSTKENSIFHKIGVAPVVFNIGLVKGSEENIANHLKNLGYYHPVVSSDITVKDKKARVRYNVTLGPTIQVDSIVYQMPTGADSLFADSFYKDTLNSLVRPGIQLSSNILEKEAVRSTHSLQNKGYYSLSSTNYFFTADTLKTPGKATLYYGIRNYVRGGSQSDTTDFLKHHFGNVKISYPEKFKFRDDILRDYNLIHPGDLYTTEITANTYSRFASMRVFSNVNIELTKSGRDTVNASITLTPSKIQGLKVDLEGSFTSTGLFGIAPKLKYYHKSLFGGGEWFDMGFSGNFQFKPNSDTKATEFGANIGLSLPRPAFFPMRWFNGKNIPRTEVKASYNYQDRPEFIRHIISGSFGYQARFGEGISLSVNPLQLSYVYLKDMSEDFRKTWLANPSLYYSYSDHIDAGIGAVLYYTSCNDVIPKRTYHYHKFSFDISGNIVSLFNDLMPQAEDGSRKLLGVPYVQYVRGSYDIAKTWFMGRKQKQSIATHFGIGAGYAYGNSNGLPFEKQFYGGGASSMRGWQSRSLGPGAAPFNTAFEIPSQAGDIKLEADLEWRALLFWKIESAVFAECGNVWTLQNDDPDNYNSHFDFSTFYKSLAFDWGVGIRLNLDFILLRVDLGLKLFEPNRAEGERWLGPGRWFSDNGYAVHFGVGYPF